MAMSSVSIAWLNLNKRRPHDSRNEYHEFPSHLLSRIVRHIGSLRARDFWGLRLKKPAGYDLPLSLCEHFATPRLQRAAGRAMRLESDFHQRNRAARGMMSF